MKKISTIEFSGNSMINNIIWDTKENNNAEWIIDSGCPINLTNEVEVKEIKKD